MGSHDRSSSLGSTGDTAKIWKIWTWWNCCGCQASCLQAKQSAPVAHHGKKAPLLDLAGVVNDLLKSFNTYPKVIKSLRPQGSSMVLWQHKAQFNQFSQRCKLDESSKIGTTWTWPAIRDWCLLSVISHSGWTPFQILSESWKVVVRRLLRCVSLQIKWSFPSERLSAGSSCWQSCNTFSSQSRGRAICLTVSHLA